MTPEWFESERGIASDTLDAFGVSFSDDAVYFPYARGEKTRKMIDGKRRFFFTTGMHPPLYNERNARHDVVFLVEGETDTMRLWQAFEDEAKEEARGYSKPSPGVVGLSGINSWCSEYAEVLKDAEKVFVILDNDPDYMVAGQVDEAWRAIRKDLGAKARRLRLPNGVKDVCEFFRDYDLATLRDISTRVGPSVSRYSPLDLQKEPPPPSWLLEGMIALGDVTLLVGDGGLGKSWWTMGLELAVAQGLPTFLDIPVQSHGRVLHVDEENPEDVIFSRLHRLGLTPEGTANIRYLSNQGIRLDKKTDEFLEEALDFNPSLIILDSLTRLHTEDENAAGAMSKLYNDGIKPLARETGAAVLLIHHTNKGQGGSYSRIRGSSDLGYAVDAGIDFRATEPYQEGVFMTKLFRSRRRKGGDEMIVTVVDREDGGAELRTDVPLDPPF